MTDRVKGFVVTLEDNIRDDDAEIISQAILLLKGVVDVEESVDDFNDQMNRSKVRREILDKLFKIVKEA